MSETLRLLTEAHQTIRTLVARLDWAQAMLAKTDDTAHALQAEVVRLRAAADELAKVDKRWAEAMRDKDALVDAVTCALDVAGFGNPADVPAERVRWAQRDLEAIKSDAERLKKERDDALERAKRSEEEVRATWQVLDGGTPVTTGLAGAVLERLKQKDAKPEVPVQEAFIRLAKTAFDASNAQHMKDRETALKALDDQFGDWLSVTIPKIVD